MASTEGLVPITRSFLASFYDKYPFQPLSDDASHLSSQIRSIVSDFYNDSPLTQGLNHLCPSFVLSFHLLCIYFNFCQLNASCCVCCVYLFFAFEFGVAGISDFWSSIPR